MNDVAPPSPSERNAVAPIGDREQGGPTAPLLAPRESTPEFTHSVNWRLLIISLVTVSVIAAAAAVRYHTQVRKHSAAFLKRAVDAQNNGDWHTAADWLGQYVEYVPDDVDGLRDLADEILQNPLEVEDFELARRLYETYLERRPKDLHAQLRIAKILLASDPKQSVQRANAILEKAPNHVEAMRIKAVGLDRLHALEAHDMRVRLVEVVNAYLELLERAPGDVENAYRVATLCREQTDRLVQPMRLTDSEVADLADRVMDRLVQEAPTSAAARMARFEYQQRYHPSRTDGEEDQLPEDLRVALQENPSDETVLFAAGIHFAHVQPGDLIHRDRLGVARQYLQRAVDAEAKSPLPYLVLGRVDWALGNRRNAVAAMESGLQRNPADISLLAALAEFKIELEKWEEADNLIAGAGRRIASLRRTRVITDEFWELGMRETEVDVLRARWYFHPRNPSRDVSKATHIVDRIVVESKPRSLTSKTLYDLGMLCIGLGKWEQAVSVFRRASFAAPQATSPRLWLVTALARVGRFSEAVDQCRILVNRTLHPQYEATVWFEYAELLLELQLAKPREERLWGELERALTHLKQNWSDDPRTLLLALEVRFLRQGPEAHAAIADTLRAAESPFQNAARFWRGAIDLYLRLNLPADAQRAIEHLAQLGGGPATASPSQSDEANADRGMNPATQESLPDTVAQTVADRLARIRSLLQQSDSGDDKSLAEAADFAASWVETEPDQLAARIGLAMVSEARGDYDQAVEAYRFVFGRGDRRLEVTNKLVSLLILNGQFEEASQYLKHLTTREKLRGAQLPLTIELAIKNGNVDQAVQFARQAVDVEPRSAEALVWLARALLARGMNEDVPEAVRALSHAVELAPADASVLVAAIHGHLQSGGPVSGRDLEIYTRHAGALRRAKGCSTSAWQYFVMARCLQLQGMAGPSDVLYRTAIQEDPGGEIRRTIPRGAIVTSPMVREPERLDDPTVLAYGKSAFQTLGLLMAAAGDEDTPPTFEYLDRHPRLRAIAALSRGQADSVPNAVRLLNQIPGHQLTGRDHLWLADLYRRHGHVKQSRNHLRVAAQAELSADELRHIAVVALRDGGVEEADLAIDKLDRIAPSDPSRLALRIQWMAARQPTASMLRVVEDGIRQVRNPRQRIVWAQTAADALVRVGHPDEAKEILETACRRDPYGDRILASWLSVQPNGADHALRLCMKLANEGELQRAASLAAVCLRHDTIDQEKRDRAEALLSKALGDQAPSTSLLVNLSQLRESQGKIDEAISLGRNAVDRRPGEPLLRNNMAWYLGAYKGQFETAIELVDASIRALGPLDSLLDTKGVVLLLSGNAQEAIRLLETATLSDDAAATIYVHLAAAYMHVGRRSDAERAFSSARQLGIDDLLPFDARLTEKLEAALHVANGPTTGGK